MKENVIKIFEVEFSWAQDNVNEDDHSAYIINYKLVIPKDIFNENTEFKFNSNYNKFNNIQGTCLQIDKIPLDLTSTPNQW